MAPEVLSSPDRNLVQALNRTMQTFRLARELAEVHVAYTRPFSAWRDMAAPLLHQARADLRAAIEAVPPAPSRSHFPEVLGQLQALVHTLEHTESEPRLLSVVSALHRAEETLFGLRRHLFFDRFPARAQHAPSLP